MFVELHMIQSFAPSNLNRDDTNNPKDCEFGGVRRARISSQCLKRAMRQSTVFGRETQVENGVRTRWIARRIKDALAKAGKPGEAAASVASEFAKAYSGKSERPKDSDVDRTSVLIYFSPEEIQRVVNGLLACWDAALTTSTNPDSKEAQKNSPFPDLVKQLVKESQGRTSAPDIALFGRMLANDPRLNLDAACQVAHAISTHRVNMEIDFFTAVDDLQPSEETGSGMMGVTSYNSACFYRYARVDWQQLLTNLDNNRELGERTLRAFLYAALDAVPSGKQSSFAAHNPPSFVLAVLRFDDQGWSLANAFEKPVTPTREAGLVAGSVQALTSYWSQLQKVYGDDHVLPLALAIDPGLALGELQAACRPTRDDWVSAIIAALPAE